MSKFREIDRVPVEVMSRAKEDENIRQKAEYTCTRFCKYMNCQPKPRLPLASYIERLNAQLNQLDKCYIDKNHDSMMSTFKSQESKFKNHKKNNDNNLHIRERIKNKSLLEQQEKSNLSDEESSNDNSTNYNKNKSITCISEGSNVNNFFWCNYIKLIILIIFIVCIVAMFYSNTSKMSKNDIQHTNNPNLFKSMKEMKAKFCNQESDTWNDISSAINEILRTSKAPSIILLYANETHILNCLAKEIAHISSTILHTNDYINLKPEDFGNDAGEIINKLNKKILTKKVVIIHNILNISAKAIEALHNLCDRENPLVAEAIYILTMQTNDYESSQKKMAFVEKQINRKLSKNIDQDILLALITRITDGAIIPVQPEPQLRYCT